jgi:dTDP-glucose 4,6-dehydratase
VLVGGKPGSIYNIGSGEEKTNIEITHLLLRHFGLSEQHIDFVEDRLGHDRRYSIDFSKISNELGYVPTTGFDIGINQTIEWYVDNFNSWVRPLLEK